MWSKVQHLVPEEPSSHVVMLQDLVPEEPLSHVVMLQDLVPEEPSSHVVMLQDLVPEEPSSNGGQRSSILSLRSLHPMWSKVQLNC